MSFGSVEINMHSVVSFSTTVVQRWINPEYDADKGNGTIVFWDCSGSMTNKEKELKLIASALKCVSNTQGKWNVVEARGLTALVDAADVVDRENTPGVSKCIIVSDGIDNASKAEFLIDKLEDDGSRVFSKFEKTFTPFHDWKTAKFTDGSTVTLDEIFTQFRDEQNAFYATKCEKVAMHLSNMKIDLVVVAVGSEVKDFVKALTKPGQRANVAHISSDATADDVIRQIVSVVKKTRRSPKNTVESAVVTADVAANDTSVATLLTNVHVASVETEADVTSVGHIKLADEYDHTKLLNYIDAIVEPECVKYGHETKHVRQAIVTFLKILHLKRDVAGPILHSKFGGFFQDPVYLATNKKSKFSTLLNSCWSLLSMPTEDSTILSNFADDIASGLVGNLLVRTGQKDSITSFKQSEFVAMQIENSSDIYMKFVKTPHYGLLDQVNTDKFNAEVAKNDDWKGLNNLKFWKGNSSESAFNSSPASSSSSSKKRSYEELELENAALKKEIEDLKKARS